MIRIKFKKTTWDDIYTSSQRNDLINRLTPVLYSILESPETKKLIGIIVIEELTDVVDRENKGYKLALDSNGLLEAKLVYAVPGGISRIDSYDKVMPKDYFETIIKYRLDYQKLDDVRKKINNRIVGH
jgi:hypothetical protein